MGIAYILQITTIVITLLLGIISHFQTKKIQHGQNIISVTTKYRSERSQQLKESGETLLTNTSPELLKRSSDVCGMLKEATRAVETIGMILHRNFEADKELIILSSDVLDAAISHTDTHSDATLNRLLYLRELFRLKCDMYAAAEWNRIKQETKGENTSSQSWIDYYEKIEASFANDLQALKAKYKQDG